jgi:hypothetical protein
VQIYLSQYIVTYNQIRISFQVSIKILYFSNFYISHLLFDNNRELISKTILFIFIHELCKYIYIHDILVQTNFYSLQSSCNDACISEEKKYLDSKHGHTHIARGSAGLCKFFVNSQILFLYFIYFYIF